MQQVVATLRARLDVVVGSPVKVAGLSDDEQARNQLASAVSSALQTADAPQDVRASVEDGLQEAVASLQQSGASSNDLDTALADLSDKLDGLFAAFAPSASAPVAGEVTAAGARLVTKEKGVLEIRTQEGDVVRVKFANKADVRAGTAQAVTGDHVFDSASLSVTARSRTELSVQGDLNADELRAIQAVVQKVDSLANEFFAGNVDEALAQAADLDIDTEQLANVALHLSLKQRVQATGLSVRPAAAPALAPSTPEEPAAAEDPAAQTPAEPVAGTTPAVTDEVVTAPAVEATVPAVEAAPAEATPTTVPPAGESADDSSPQTVIAKFVSRLLATFESTEGETRLNLSFKMKLQLLTCAIEAKQPDDSPQAQAGVKKLCDVAETAAA